MSHKNYPTEWMYGKPRGSIMIYKNKAYKVVITPPKTKTNIKPKSISKYFYFCKYDTQKNAYKESEKFRLISSNLNNLTTNQIRYISKDTIEVKLNTEKILITDSKFIPIIQKNKLCVKQKKTKNGSVFYACYRGEKKRTYPFYRLICNIEHVKYKNSNTLDNRLCNIIDTGDVDTKDTKYNDAKDQYEYFNMNHDKLPKNKWILGKPIGTVFQRKNSNIWTGVINSKPKTHNKTFSFNKNNKDDVYKKAKKWQIETSYKLGLTKNLIRILDNDIIEVKIRDDYVMKTDLNKLKNVQKYYLCLTKGGHKNSEYYITASVGKKMIPFHKLITGFTMTDHIDRNPLNNCISNLRNTNFIENNRNSSIPITNTTGYVGISYDKRNNAWRGRFKINNIEHEKSFSVNKHGFYRARELAIITRIKYCILFKSRNGLGGMKESWKSARDIKKTATINDIKKRMKNLKRLMNDILHKTIYDPNITDEISRIYDSDGNDNIKNKKLFTEYIKYKFTYHSDCCERMKNLNKILNKLLDKYNTKYKIHITDC
uniref:HNH endonuclease n=1 Tax=Mimivirus LCMiAC01 TaxID=2506608 RepID=A0A481Z1K4_9VIRU|nr:MAG: HNH endonuclease [Mimivirus LCMiAC01]